MLLALLAAALGTTACQGHETSTPAWIRTAGGMPRRAARSAAAADSPATRSRPRNRCMSRPNPRPLRRGPAPSEAAPLAAPGPVAPRDPPGPARRPSLPARKAARRLDPRPGRRIGARAERCGAPVSTTDSGRVRCRSRGVEVRGPGPRDRPGPGRGGRRPPIRRAGGLDSPRVVVTQGLARDGRRPSEPSRPWAILGRLGGVDLRGRRRRDPRPRRHALAAPGGDRSSAGPGRREPARLRPASPDAAVGWPGAGIRLEGFGAEAEVELETATGTLRVLRGLGGLGGGHPRGWRRAAADRAHPRDRPGPRADRRRPRSAGWRRISSSPGASTPRCPSRRTRPEPAARSRWRSPDLEA